MMSELLDAKIHTLFYAHTQTLVCKPGQKAVYQGRMGQWRTEFKQEAEERQQHDADTQTRTWINTFTAQARACIDTHILMGLNEKVTGFVSVY